MSAKNVDISFDWICMLMPACLSICWITCARELASASCDVLNVNENPFG